uniref:Peptidase n=1 Tax=viral metagenome TaxID=1070528 RepID=A0A6H1ZLA0_9ZZZZ
MKIQKEVQALWETKFVALGKEYTLALYPNDTALSPDKGSDLGVHWKYNNEIGINAGIPFTSRDETLLHEILHVLDDDFKLNLGHNTIYRLSSSLYGFLKGLNLWQDFPWPDKERGVALK